MATEKPKKKNDSVAVEVQVQEKPVEAVPVSIESILQKVDPAKLKMASELGLPIAELLLWCRQQEQGMNALRKNLPQDLQRAVRETIQELQAEQQRAYNETLRQQGMQQEGPQPRQGYDLPSIIAAVAGQGGNPDGEMAQLGKDLIRAQIERVKAEGSMLQELGKVVISKVMAKGVKDTVAVVTG